MRYKACFVETTSEGAWNIYTLPEGIDSIMTGPHRWLHICIYILSFYSGNRESVLKGGRAPKCVPLMNIVLFLRLLENQTKGCQSHH